jgi:hypothetical protein
MTTQTRRILKEGINNMVSESNSSIPRPLARPRLYWVLSNNWELFKRSVIHIYRTPDQFVSGVILQPLLLLGSFAILFGNAIATGAANYVSFLLPGTLVMISIHITLRTPPLVWQTHQLLPI